MSKGQKTGPYRVNYLLIYAFRSDPASFGNYTCDASNSVGSVRYDISLKKSVDLDPVKDSPDPILKNIPNPDPNLEKYRIHTYMYYMINLLFFYI